MELTAVDAASGRNLSALLAHAHKDTNMESLYRGQYWKVRDNALVRLENPSARFIDYQLRILGIRVWERSCQLIAKSGAEWITLGPGWDLPMNVPHTAEELKAASEEPLRLTAYQYCAEHPDSDLAEMLNKTGDFSAALHSPPKQRD